MRRCFTQKMSPGGQKSCSIPAATLTVCVFTLAFIGPFGCTKLQLHIPTPEQGLQGKFPTSANTGDHIDAAAPLPPLELVETISLPAAPLRKLQPFGDYLLIGTQVGRIIAYHIEQGRLRGRIKLPDNIMGRLAVHHSGILVIGLEIGHETLLAYNLGKGEFRWKRRAGLLGGYPVIADSSIYIVARFKHADRYLLRDGRRLWRFDFDSQAHTTPALSEKSIIFGTDSGQVFALLRASGEKIWQQEVGGAVFASPVVAGDRVYIGAVDSTLRAFDLHTGTPIWQRRVSGRIRYTPALAGNMLVAGTGDGSVYGLDAATGKVHWRSAATSGISTSPLIVADVVYVGSLDRHLYAFDLRDGASIWQVELHGRVRTDPLVVGDALLVGSEDKYVYIFKPVNSISAR